LTAVLIAPNTPSAPHTSTSVPATLKVIRLALNASSCAVMKSNCRGKYWRMNPSTASLFASSAVTPPSTARARSTTGKSDNKA